MTIGIQNPVSFACDGTTKVFPIPIQAYAAADISIVLTAPASAGGGEATLLLNSDYSMAVAGTLQPNAWVLTTLAAAAYGVGYTLQAFINPVQQQQTQFVQGQAFPSLAVQTAFDRLTQISQRLQYQISRSVRAPDGDVSPVMLLPLVNARKNTALMFDGAGNVTIGVPNTQVITTDLLAPFLALDTSAAETAALVTPTSKAYARRPYIDISRYGAVLDGSANDYSAWVSAMAVAAIFGAGIVCPGMSAIASASLGTTGISIPNNVEVLFPNKACGITVTGATACNIFVATNKKGFTVRGGTVTGNNQGTGLTDGQFIRYVQDNSAAAVGGDVEVVGTTITNFKGDYWTYFLNSGTTYAMTNIRVHECKFVSVNGNSRDPTSLGAGAYCVVVQGSSTSVNGLVRDVEVYSNYCEGTYIKGFGVAWQGSYNVKFHHNEVLNAGVVGANDDKAAYALFTYDNSAGAGGAIPDLIHFYDNALIAPRSNGVYVAAANRVYVDSNLIIGVTDTSDATLPKGAVSVNGCTYAYVANNIIDDCYGGVRMYGNTANDTLIARGNKMKALKANSYGIEFRTTFAGNAKHYEAQGNTIDASGATTWAMHLRFTSTRGASRLIIKDNPLISGTSYCIGLYSPDATIPNLGYCDFTGNVLAGNGADFGIFWNNAQNAATRATFRNNKYIGTWSAAGVMLAVPSSYGLTVKDEEFCDMTTGTGFAFKSDLARGRVEGLRFNNVAAARQYYTSGGEELAVDAPTWGGVINDFVQALNASEAGAAASKYVNLGWRYDGTAWREARALTGN